MSEASALRPGQKVTLTAWVKHAGPNRVWIEIGRGSYVARDSNEVNVPASALTPVVEPEPQWTPGDVVRIDGVNYMLIGNVWHASDGGWALSRESLSECWREGRVVVVYRKEDDK